MRTGAPPPAPSRFPSLRGMKRPRCRMQAAPSRGNRGRSGRTLLTGPAASAQEVLEGKEGRGGAPWEEHEHLATHPHAHTHTRGHSLLAAARPVMGIYFPQLRALVPSLSSSAQCSQANERLPVMKQSHARGRPGTCPLGWRGCSHTRPRIELTGALQPPATLHPTPTSVSSHIPRQVTLILPQELSACVTFSLT